jgi:phage tail protein X
MAMQWLYTTRSGDTWDILAMDFYGDEHLAGFLQQANPTLLDYLFFPSGLTIIVPQTPVTATAQPKPPWQRDGAAA